MAGDWLCHPRRSYGLLKRSRKVNRKMSTNRADGRRKKKKNQLHATANVQGICLHRSSVNWLKVKSECWSPGS